MADRYFLIGGEFLGGSEDVDEEEAVVRRPVAHQPGIVEGDRGVAGLRKQGFFDARRDEVLTTAQEQRGDGRRFDDWGVEGRVGGEHEIEKRRCALGNFHAKCACFTWRDSWIVY